MTITVTQAIKDTISRGGETQFPLLVNIHLGTGDTIRLTTNQESLTYDGNYYSSDSYPLKNVVLGGSGALVERERFSVSFVDSARTIHPFLQQHKTATISIEVLVVRPDGSYAGSFPIASGIMSNVIHGINSSSPRNQPEALTTVDVVGLFPKLDYTSFRRTTEESQRKFDSSDNIFEYVNVPLDQVWGHEDG